MDVDYDIYADGEALLGWLNATCRCHVVDAVRRQPFLQRLADAVRGRLAGAGIEIAHFKMTLTPDTGSDLAVLNLVRTDGRAELPHRLADDLTDGELIVNLRAEGDPEQLKSMAMAGLDETARELGVAVAGRSHRALPAGPAAADASDGRAMSEPGGAHPLLPLRLREGGAAGGEDRRPEGPVGSRRGVRRGARSVRDGGARRSTAARARAAEAPLRIAACYPRAVKWLFASAGAPLPEQHVRIWNMRVEPADAVIDGLAGLRRDAPQPA